MIFRDREEAGGLLGDELSRRELTDPLVLAIPRGGVVVGAGVARRIGADLDVILSRKLRSPVQPELALGAVAEDGQIHVDPRLPEDPRLRSYLENEARRELEEIRRRVQLFRGGRSSLPVAGRSVIVVDDGIATGSTAMAAIRTLRAMGPREIIIATPVMPEEHLPEFKRVADSVVALQTPEDFEAIGEFYRDFSPVPDGEVVRLLEENRRSRTGDAT